MTMVCIIRRCKVANLTLDERRRRGDEEKSELVAIGGPVLG